MAPFVLAAAAFWTLAYCVIVGGLAAVESRVRNGPGGEVRAAGPYAGLVLVGFLCLGAGKLLASGPLPLSSRIAWNGACAVWVVFEWSLLVHLLGLIDASSSRFLGRRAWRVPRTIHLAGYLLVLLATFLYHLKLYSEIRSATDLARGCHFFVRLAGFAYLALEAAICLALLRARIVLGSLLALA